MAEKSETLAEKAGPKTYQSESDNLFSAFERLDLLLERAIARAETIYDSQVAPDLYRSLCVSQEEVKRLLAYQPGVPLFPIDGPESREAFFRERITSLFWLQQTFNLSLFDLDVILIALAPEVDRRYERLYAYLQDRVSRNRPTVDLVLNLLCADAAERLERRIHFEADAPLVRHGLIHLIPEPDQTQPSLLAHALVLDEQIVHLLLKQRNLDYRLAPFCQIIQPQVYWKQFSLDAETKRTLSSLVLKAWEAGQPLRLYFYGSPGVGKRRIAEVLAAEVQAPLLVADLARLIAASIDFEQAVRLLFREAWFQGAILYLKGIEVMFDEKQAVSYRQLLNALSQDLGITIIAGTHQWVLTADKPIGAIYIPFSTPSFTQRRSYWLDYLQQADILISDADINALASRFRLTRDRIAEAVATACNSLCWRAAGIPHQLSSQSKIEELFAAARLQSSQDLAALARKIEPIYTWEDIILSDDILVQLRELCQRVANRDRVFEEWGFEQKLSLGKGINALFTGSSGTGKTMAVEIIANELGLDLYKIDLSGVVSKYIGETEKNLNRIFSAAENANAILFFDEADALFGKRSEVRDSHDRYANIEISYLLQKMEEYEGLSILATNLNRNLDAAFLRRLTFTIPFPFPDETNRQRIWERVWPAATPLADDVDLKFMARQFKLAGGNIKNIALAAAFLAVKDGSAIEMSHLLQATRREYQKLGKTLSEEELKGTQEKRHLLTEN